MQIGFNSVGSIWSAALYIIVFFPLVSCSSTNVSKQVLKDVPIVTVSELGKDPSIYDNQHVIIHGCLDFHGSLKYKLWRFDLSDYQNSSDSIFVDGKYISSRYRKDDIERETRTGETTYNIETVRDYEWRVLVYGKFLDRPNQLNTGGHILFDDFFEFTLNEARVVYEFYEGCDEDD